MAAEVVNMDRNILVHGPDEDTFGDVNHTQFKQGFHIGTFNADESDDSIFTVKYIRVQNCGQNDVMGRYCFHFHLKKDWVIQFRLVEKTGSVQNKLPISTILSRH